MEHPEEQLWVDNLREGDVLGYPLFRLVGHTSDPSAKGFVEVRVSSLPSGGGGVATQEEEEEEEEEERGERRWPVAGGRFKALVLLSRGENAIHLCYAPAALEEDIEDASPHRRRVASARASPRLLLLRCHYEPLLIDNRFARDSLGAVVASTALHEFKNADERSTDGEGREPWRRFVRLVYLIARDDGLDDRLDDAGRANVERLALGALMMQAFCAQNLQEEAEKEEVRASLPFPLGACTFGLELSLDRPARNWPVVHVIRSRLSRDEIFRLGKNWSDGGHAGWNHFAAELAALPHRANSIDCAILGMTRYNPDTGSCYAHTALGGGCMALFGSGGLYSWPRTIDEVQRCWMDATKVDKSCHFDDSGGRGTMWANFATTLGATLHEVGHCFGLDHTAHGIMMRGFDNFNRWTMIEEPGFKVKPIMKPDEGGAHWHPESIALLAHSPYFKPASLSSVLVRLLHDDPSNAHRRARSRVAPLVQLQVIPAYRPPKHTRTSHVHWEKQNTPGEYFEKCDRQDTNAWVEIHGGNLFCRFTEVNYKAEEGCVILFDIGRHILVKLDRARAYWASVDAPDDQPDHWNPETSGQWQDDHFTGQH